MLIHAVIDAVVDLAVPIERAIAEAFAELESAVLENPDIKQSKELYRLRSALTILMDDISAIGSVVKSLCDHQEAPTLSRPDDADPTSTPQEVLVPISPLAKIYLQDVNDHITMLANATLRGVHSAENLTSLIFNTITARQNGKYAEREREHGERLLAYRWASNVGDDDAACAEPEMVEVGQVEGRAQAVIVMILGCALQDSNT
ncbi:hypothetical protein LTR95_013251 [Oleoguttula sp. CCFEE 5521]